MYVNQIMTTNLICISPFSKAADASAIMIKHRVRRLLVVEDNLLIGIITHNDLPRNINPQLSVKDIMTVNPVSINENATLNEAVRVMRNLGIGSLPVINNFGKAVGILTNYDLNQKLLD